MLDDLMVILKFNEVREFYVEKPLSESENFTSPIWMIFSQVNRHVKRCSDQQLFCPSVVLSRIFGCIKVL